MKEILGYYGTTPCYYTKKVIQKEQTKRGATIMDFSNIKAIGASLLKYVVVALIAFLCGMLVTGNKFTSEEVLKEKVTLVDVMVTWNGADEEIVLIDRKTSKAIILSKEVTTAVFSLKASAIQQDFSSVTKGGVAPARRVQTTQPVSTPSK